MSLPYLHISTSGEALLKDRASKFYAYAFPCISLVDLETKLLELKKIHPTARHFCWASRMGQPLEERANDAGEPAHSAGTPILHALQSAQVEQSAVVVVRYFGGTKLGVPGLIAAYRSAADAAIAEAGSEMVYPMATGKLNLPYALIGTAELQLRLCEAQILDQTFGESCGFHFTLKLARKAELSERLQPYPELELTWNS